MILRTAYSKSDSPLKCCSSSILQGVIKLTHHSERMRKWPFGITAAVVLIFSLVGCATTPRFSDRTLLSFLKNGTTTKETVFLKLGHPSGTFNGERIVTYKLGGDNEKGFFVLDRVTGWTEAKYNLVLIFDENNLLSNHSLVQVR